MSQGIIDLLESIKINEVNGAHGVRVPLIENSIHAAVQSRAIGETGQSIKSRQMVDLSFGNLSLGDILGKNDHTSVFHGLHGEFKCPPILHLDYKSSVAAV